MEETNNNTKIEIRPTLIEPKFTKLFSKIYDANNKSYADAIDLMNSKKWYSTSFNYYDKTIKPTIDGMLGGLAFVHKDESEWTRNYLGKIHKGGILADKKDKKEMKVLDIGAGIGRVTRYALSTTFGKSDLLEANKHYLEETFKNFASEPESSANKRICLGVQKLKEINSYEKAIEIFSQNEITLENNSDSNKVNEIEEYKYDAIFFQWVIGYCSDDDFILGLKALDNITKKGGIVILKENYSPKGTYYIDREDYNILRPIEIYHEIFKRANYLIIDEQDPTNWPQSLFPIRVFTLISTENLKYNEAAKEAIKNKRVKTDKKHKSITSKK